jgi:hypothetical protein
VEDKSSLFIQYKNEVFQLFYTDFCSICPPPFCMLNSAYLKREYVGTVFASGGRKHEYFCEEREKPTRCNN